MNLRPNLTGNISGHYTYGRGYYEEYKTDDDLADYNPTYSRRNHHRFGTPQVVR